jgi:hypothetical protein
LPDQHVTNRVSPVSTRFQPDIQSLASSALLSNQPLVADLGVGPGRGVGGGRWILMLPLKVLIIVACPLSRGSPGRNRGVGAILRLADAEGDSQT